MPPRVPSIYHAALPKKLQGRVKMPQAASYLYAAHRRCREYAKAGLQQAKRTRRLLIGPIFSGYQARIR